MLSIHVQSSLEIIVKALKYFAIDTHQATEAETQRWRRVATVMKAYGLRLSDIKRRYAIEQLNVNLARRL